jgi:hypothetical protein
MKMVDRKLGIGMLLFALMGCSGAAQPLAGDGGFSFQASPLMSIQSSSGKLTIQVFTAPDQPPVRGDGAVRLVVTDLSGAPVNGLNFAIQPWMPAMGHGTSVTPDVAAEDGGVYDATNVDLIMPGTWELQTQITGAVNDSANPSFNVN